MYIVGAFVENLSGGAMLSRLYYLKPYMIKSLIDMSSFIKVHYSSRLEIWRGIIC